MKKLSYKETKKQKSSNLITIGACFIVFTVIYATIAITRIYKNKKFIENLLDREMQYSEIDELRDTYQKILSQIERENIPIKESDFTLGNDQGNLSATITYNDSFCFFEVPIKKYHFKIKKKKSVSSE